MSSHEDAAPMRAEQRLQEVAAILGKGILRLRARGALPSSAPEQIRGKETTENSPGLP